jgi:hypothetical protein
MARATPFLAKNQDWSSMGNKEASGAPEQIIRLQIKQRRERCET